MIFTRLNIQRLRTYILRRVVRVVVDYADTVSGKLFTTRSQCRRSRGLRWKKVHTDGSHRTETEGKLLNFKCLKPNGERKKN